MSAFLGTNNFPCADRGVFSSGSLATTHGGVQMDSLFGASELGDKVH